MFQITYYIYLFPDTFMDMIADNILAMSEGCLNACSDLIGISRLTKIIRRIKSLVELWVQDGKGHLFVQRNWIIKKIEMKDTMS